jgi:signal transduction histidine kinase
MITDTLTQANFAGENVLPDPASPPGGALISVSEARTRAARLVHDLRNPLLGILGAASLMRRSDAPGRPGPERLLDIVETSGKHMLRLVSEIIDLALSDEPRLPVQPARVDVRRVLQQSLDIVAPLAARKGLALSLDVAASIPQTVALDALRISQVLVNLAANAVRFTDTGHVKVSVAAASTTAVAAHTSPAILRFEVCDTGVGMPEEDLLQLLTCLRAGHYHAPANTVHRRGSGFGLTTCQGILMTMGSALNIASESGRGTKVWFLIQA